MSTLLPTVYQQPPRLGRGRHLNTILEEKEDAHQSIKSDSEGDGSDTTIIGRPAAWDPRLFTAAPRKSSLATTTTYPLLQSLPTRAVLLRPAVLATASNAILSGAPIVVVNPAPFSVMTVPLLPATRRASQPSLAGIVWSATDPVATVIQLY